MVVNGFKSVDKVASTALDCDRLQGIKTDTIMMRRSMNINVLETIFEKLRTSPLIRTTRTLTGSLELATLHDIKG